MKSQAQRNRLLPGVFILALLIGFGSFGTANALTISQTLYTPELRSTGSSTSSSNTLSFEKFNSILENGHIGILNNITITMAGSVLADFSIQNTGNTTVNVNSNIAGQLLLSLAGNDIITLEKGSWVYTSKNGLAAGATYIKNDQLGTGSESTTLTSSSDLALFTGTGSIDLQAYSNLMVSTGISGGTDYINASKAWAQEGITVTYDYTDGGVPPVPEPATLLLFGSGIAGLLGYGYNKKKSSNIS